MSSKTLLKFLGGCLVLLLVFGLNVRDSGAQVVSGNTAEPSGQLIVPFIQDTTSSLRGSIVQVTNTNPDLPVNLHIQVLNGNSPTCVECDFFDTLTPSDTVFYNINDLETNSGGFAPCSISNGLGIMVITPIEGTNFDESGAVAFNHLHGVSVNVHLEGEAGLGPFDYRFNVVGRDAILASGAKAANGTAVDGVGATFSSIQPNSYHIQYSGPGGDGPSLDDLVGISGAPVFADAIFVALTDDFGGGSYSPQPGTSPLFTIDVFDEDENPQSCDEVSFTCIEVVGINNQHITTLHQNLDDGSGEDDIDSCETAPAQAGCSVICANGSASHATGYTRLRSIGAGTADVNFGILGFAVTNAGAASHIFVK